jgi:hypothetical protein
MMTMPRDRFHTLYRFIEENHKGSRRGFKAFKELANLPAGFSKKQFQEHLRTAHITQGLWCGSELLFDDFVLIFPNLFTQEEKSFHKYGKDIKYFTYMVDSLKHKTLCDFLEQAADNFHALSGEETSDTTMRRYEITNNLLRFCADNGI